MALVRMDARQLPGGSTRLPPMQRDYTAFPTWDAAGIEQFNRLGWDGYWAEHPAGAARLVRVAGTSFEDAVAAAKALVATSRPNSAPGDRQAHAVLQAADGAWYIAGLGQIVPSPFGNGARLASLGPFPGFHRWKLTALVPELQAIVGGVSVVDLRRANGGTGTTAVRAGRQRHGPHPGRDAPRPG